MELEKPENVLSLTTVGENVVGHLPAEKFYEIIKNPDSPFSVVLEAGGARFKFLGVDDLFNSFIVGKI